MDKFQQCVQPHLEEIRAMLSAGNPESAVAGRLGVSPASLRRYRREHPELAALWSEARAAAAAAADDLVEDALFKRATGYDVEEEEHLRHVPADVKAAVFWLKNRRPARWKERQELAVGAAEPVRLLADEEKL